MSAAKSIQLYFKNEKKRFNGNGGTILDAAVELGVDINAACGGSQVCGRCKVKIGSGHYPPSAADQEFLSLEEINSGLRLACSQTIRSNAVIETLPLLSENAAQILEAGIQKRVEIDSGLFTVEVELDPFSDWSSDFERLRKALSDPDISIFPALLAQLPFMLKNSTSRLQLIIRDHEIIAIADQGARLGMYGLAVDLGTTTVVCKLLDLGTGTVLATDSKLNSQQAFGSDVISRISFCLKETNGTVTLQSTILDQLNSQISALCNKGGVRPQEIFKVQVSGNTVMLHLFWGISPHKLAELPFMPVFRAEQRRRADGLLNINPAAMISSFPVIGGYVGGDTTAVLLALANGLAEPWLAVDIGTNGEVVLANNGQIYCCSTAAGPAFEGARISCGMRAVTGAVSAVSLTDSPPSLHVIGNGEAKGFCGSGLVDAVAYLLRNGYLSETGRLTTGGQQHTSSYQFTPAISLSQKDIREVQLAKGAIAAGIQVLLKRAGVAASELKALYLAGAFGQYIKKESAVRIGLLPTLPLNRIHFIGNAACSGAQLALVSKQQNKLAALLARRAQHIEISTDSQFHDLFTENMLFPAQEIRNN